MTPAPQAQDEVAGLIQKLRAPKYLRSDWPAMITGEVAFEAAAALEAQQAEIAELKEMAGISRSNIARVCKLATERRAEIQATEGLYRSWHDRALKAEAEIARLRGCLPDPEKLEILAAWFDGRDDQRYRPDREVQADLRLWASNARAALAEPES